MPFIQPYSANTVRQTPGITGETPINSANTAAAVCVKVPEPWAITAVQFSHGASSATCRVVIYGSNSDGSLNNVDVKATSASAVPSGYGAHRWPISYTCTAGETIWICEEYVSGTSSNFTLTARGGFHDWPWMRMFFTNDAYGRLIPVNGQSILIETSNYGNYTGTLTTRDASSGVPMYNDESTQRRVYSGWKVRFQKPVWIDSLGFCMRKYGAPSGWSTFAQIYDASKTLIAQSGLGQYKVEDLHLTNFYTQYHAFDEPVQVGTDQDYYLVLTPSLLTCGNSSNYAVSGLGSSWNNALIDAKSPLVVMKAYVYCYSDATRFAEYTTGNMPTLYIGCSYDPPSGGGLLVNPGFNGGLVQI